MSFLSFNQYKALAQISSVTYHHSFFVYGFTSGGRGIIPCLQCQAQSWFYFSPPAKWERKAEENAVWHIVNKRKLGVMLQDMLHSRMSAPYHPFLVDFRGVCRGKWVPLAFRKEIHPQGGDFPQMYEFESYTFYFRMDYIYN